MRNETGNDDVGLKTVVRRLTVMMIRVTCLMSGDGLEMPVRCTISGATTTTVDVREVTSRRKAG